MNGIKKLDLDLGEYQLDFHPNDAIVADEFAKKIIPHFNGMTFNQIEMGIQNALDLFRCSHTIYLNKKTN